jgi:hypothetical protein
MCELTIVDTTLDAMLLLMQMKSLSWARFLMRIDMFRGGLEKMALGTQLVCL